MTSLPDLDSGTVRKKETVKIGSYSILLTTHDRDSSIILYFGSHELYCLEIFIIKNKANMPSGCFDPKEASISRIEFNSTCSLEYNLKRGLDINTILRFAISHIKRTYPYVKGILFNDMSFRTSGETYQRIGNAFMNYIATGQTWYEKHFGAYLDTFSKEIFDTYAQNFQEEKKKIPWEIMKEIIEHEYPIGEEHMKELYESANTWQEFFGPIFTILGPREFCDFVSRWL